MCAENSWDQDYCDLSAKNQLKDKVAHLRYTLSGKKPSRISFRHIKITVTENFKKNTTVNML